MLRETPARPASSIHLLPFDSNTGTENSQRVAREHEYRLRQTVCLTTPNRLRHRSPWSSAFSQENASGYDDNSPINHVEKLKGNYLLVHGMADDNVHYQNAVEMSAALIKANKQFTGMMYPNKNHGIYGGNTRLHLYTLMTNFILDNL